MPLRQFISDDEAIAVSKQPTAPCSDCPFTRSSLAGWLGNASVDDWIQAVHAEQELACHTLFDKDGAPVSCAGGAIYRANTGKLLRDPDAFTLEANHRDVFSTSAQFVAHHMQGVGAEEARRQSRPDDVT